MATNMNDLELQKKRNLAVVPGALYATRKQRATRVMTSGEWSLDREIRGAFAAVKGADGTAPSTAFYNIAEHRQHPWRIIARRFVEARDAGTHPDQLLVILDVFRWWVMHKLYRPTRDKAA